MFKSDRHTWLYLIGIALMFGILILFTKEVVFPFFKNRGSIDLTLNTTLKKPGFIIDRKNNYFAKFHTNYGDITVDLYEINAPQNVNSFVYLAQNNYYNSTKFHRLIPDFLIQGGDRNTLDSDPTNDGKGRPNYLIEDEVNWDSLNLSQDQRNKLKSAGFTSNTGVTSRPLERYSVAMANSGPNTNGSQFFIVTADVNDSRLNDLNGFYTVIGKISGGSDVVEKLNKVSVDNPSAANPRPTSDIVINSIEIFTR